MLLSFKCIYIKPISPFNFSKLLYFVNICFELKSSEILFVSYLEFMFLEEVFTIS